MLRLLHSNSIVFFLLSNLILIMFLPVNSLSYDIPWWDMNWSFIQEINLPINTNAEIAKYQPIDIRIEFDKTCWAINENKHSVRVCCLNENKWDENTDWYLLYFASVNPIQTFFISRKSLLDCRSQRIFMANEIGPSRLS